MIYNWITVHNDEERAPGLVWAIPCPLNVWWLNVVYAFLTVMVIHNEEEDDFHDEGDWEDVEHNGDHRIWYKI